MNVQLIKAANDSHVWADTFDRKLTDILSVESEVAKAIAEKLRVTLTGQEEQLIAAKPTDNLEAYDAYLRGLAYTLKGGDTIDDALGAQKYLREAVRLDPKFALAWALLSYTDASRLCHQGPSTDRCSPRRGTAGCGDSTHSSAQSRRSVDGHGPLSLCLFKDYDSATRYLEQARQRLPNDSRIPESLAYVTRRRGQWDRSETYFKEAEQLSARDA